MSETLDFLLMLWKPSVRDTVTTGRGSGFPQRLHVGIKVVLEPVYVGECVDLIREKMMGRSSATMRASATSRKHTT